VIYNGVGESGLSQLLTKRLTTPGGSDAPAVAPELFPVLALENDRPEWGYLKGEGHYAVYIAVGAVAAEYGMAQLYLPTTARTIAVVTEISSPDALAKNVGMATGISGGIAGWAAGTTLNMDSRRRGQGGAVLYENNTDVAQPAVHGRAAQLTVAGQSVRGPFILAPGGCLMIYSVTVNQSMLANVRWYERPAEPGELV